MLTWIRQIPEGRTRITANLEDIGEIKQIALDKHIVSQEGVVDVDNPVTIFLELGDYLKMVRIH